MALNRDKEKMMAIHPNLNVLAELSFADMLTFRLEPKLFQLETNQRFNPSSSGGPIFQALGDKTVLWKQAMNTGVGNKLGDTLEDVII